jgi:SnoaL-like protein
MRRVTYTFARETENIRDLITRSSHAINCQDWHALMSMMTDDIVWERRPPTPWTLDGRAAVDSFLAKNSGKLDILHYDVSIRAIDVIDATHAISRSTMHELIGIRESGAVIGVVAMYDDRFVKRNGSWFFERRTITPQREEHPASASLQSLIRSHAARSPLPTGEADERL